VWSSLVAVIGIGLLFVHEFRQHSARASEIALGIGLTLIGMIGASAANVFQARDEVRRFPLFSMLAWSMVAGAVMDSAIAFLMTGPPVFDSRPGYWLGVFYLALPASVLTFSLYYPVVRKIGPAKAAYSSAIIPIIAMTFSTALEGYKWSALAITGAILAIGGMIGALKREKAVVAPPDAA
jgi:drug/metabolite transporter (DMT)-like permease